MDASKPSKDMKKKHYSTKRMAWPLGDSNICLLIPDDSSIGKQSVTNWYAVMSESASDTHGNNK